MHGGLEVITILKYIGIGLLALALIVGIFLIGWTTAPNQTVVVETETPPQAPSADDTTTVNLTPPGVRYDNGTSDCDNNTETLDHPFVRDQDTYIALLICQAEHGTEASQMDAIGRIQNQVVLAGTFAQDLNDSTYIVPTGQAAGLWCNTQNPSFQAPDSMLDLAFPFGLNGDTPEPWDSPMGSWNLFFVHPNGSGNRTFEGCSWVAWFN